MVEVSRPVTWLLRLVAIGYIFFLDRVTVEEAAL